MYLNRTWDSGWFHGASATTCYEVSAWLLYCII
jgi:hypothetical protein